MNKKNPSPKHPSHLPQYSFHSRRGDVQQVFVYLFSIIIISFAGFLVVQFIGVFTEDVDSRTDIVFFDRVSSAYDGVAKEWNSEKLETFRVTDNTEYACFMEPSCDTSTLPVDADTLDTVIEGEDNIALFSSNENLIQSGSIGSFQTQDDCFCIDSENITNNRFELFIENRRNDVHINK